MTDIILHLEDSPATSLAAPRERSLYDSLADAGIGLRKACINGACGICRCRLMSGAIDYRGRHPYGLNDVQQAEGWILPCIAFPKADLQLAQLRRQDPKE